eukprot:178102_1
MSGFDLAEKVRICVLGETVGKSSLVHRFVNGSFCGQQIQHQHMEETHHKHIKILNQTFDLNIIDTTNNHEVEATQPSCEDILQIEWKGMDGYSMDIRQEWLLESDVLFLLFNRLNSLSWMILQAIHDVAIKVLSDKIAHIPVYIISTCSDLYLSQSSLSNLDSFDLVSFKEVTDYIANFDHVFHFETSSKMDHNVAPLFKSAVTKYDELCTPKLRKKKRKQRKKIATPFHNKIEPPALYNAEEAITDATIDNTVNKDKTEPISNDDQEETKLDPPIATETLHIISSKDDDDNDYNGRLSSPSESSLSSKDMYGIQYSSKYNESIEFKNIQKTFNTCHQIKVTYAQIEDTNPEYKSSCLLFFKDLDATLSTIGCVENDKKMFFIQCRQHIVYKMMDQLHVVKHRYEYLKCITLLTGPLILRLDELQGENYWNVLSDVSFVSKLEFSYDLWMQNNKKSEIEFRNELSGALHINPIYIRINGVGKGLNDIVIDWTVMYIWIPYYIQGVQTDLMRREYRIRPQDQVEVEYKKQWIPCTVIEVKDVLNAKGKQIKVRYNTLNGRDRFTKNTEWMWTVKHCERLRLPDKVYVIVSYNNVQIGTIFKPPLLAHCREGNKEYIEVGHHIFVNRNGIWYRCEVINAVLEGKKIQILYLVHTFVKNTEWIRLWEPADLRRISLNDMRL